jgi:L-threonylcarbamoyladenylate synthase
VAASGDTVPGLLAVAGPASYARLDAIKNRVKKPYILLANGFEMVETLISAVAVHRWRQFMHLCWPGPVTLILPAHESVALRYGPTIAIRIPNYEPLQRLMGAVGPLYSTSANASGQPTLTSLDALDETIKQQVDALVISDDQPDR